MRIPLKVQGIADFMSEDTGLSLLIITDEAEKRQIAIMVDISLRIAFAIRRAKYVGNKEQQRLATEALQHTLPETLSAIIKYMTDLELAVIIVGIFNGEYQAVLEDQRTGTAFPIRAADGILLAYADRHIPLYIEQSLWKTQSTKYSGEKSNAIALPLNTLTPSMLQAAMNKCIDEEKYEIAEQVKLELQRRGITFELQDNNNIGQDFNDDYNDM